MRAAAGGTDTHRTTPHEGRVEGNRTHSPAPRSPIQLDDHHTHAPLTLTDTLGLNQSQHKNRGGREGKKQRAQASKSSVKDKSEPSSSGRGEAPVREYVSTDIVRHARLTSTPRESNVDSPVEVEEPNCAFTDHAPRNGRAPPEATYLIRQANSREEHGQRSGTRIQGEGEKRQ